MISPPSTVANVPAVTVKVSPSASVSLDCKVAVELYNTSEVTVAESSTAIGAELFGFDAFTVNVTVPVAVVCPSPTVYS